MGFIVLDLIDQNWQRRWDVDGKRLSKDNGIVLKVGKSREWKALRPLPTEGRDGFFGRDLLDKLKGLDGVLRSKE